MQNENLPAFRCPLRGQKLSQRDSLHLVSDKARVLHHSAVTGVSVTGPSNPQSVSGQLEASKGL